MMLNYEMLFRRTRKKSKLILNLHKSSNAVLGIELEIVIMLLDHWKLAIYQNTNEVIRLSGTGTYRMKQSM